MAHNVDTTELVPIVEADAAQIAAAGPSRPALAFGLRVLPGQLHLVHSRDPVRSEVLADALLGLTPASRGAIAFNGEDWRRLPGDTAFNRRRIVGRVPGRGGWMETRSVMDNVLLPMRHHTLLPDATLRTAASDIARRFGLPGLPLQLPGRCAEADLRRAACVRAFLGRPTLVILEHPSGRGDPDLLSPLIDAIQQVRRRRGAVIWLTEHEALLRDHGIPADHRHRIVGAELRTWEEQT